MLADKGLVRNKVKERDRRTRIVKSTDCGRRQVTMHSGMMWDVGELKKQTRDQFSHEGEGFAQTIKYPCPFHRLGLKYFFFFFRRKVSIAKTTYLTLEKPRIFVGSLICFFLQWENGKAFIVCECNVGLDPVVFYQLCIPITNIYEIIENNVILSLRNKGFSDFRQNVTTEGLLIKDFKYVNIFAITFLFPKYKDILFLTVLIFDFF